MFRKAGIIFLFVLLFCVYWYRLPTAFEYDTDQARDLTAMTHIIKQKPTLLGPMLSVGIFAGPYYYYLLLPSLVISGFSPYAPVFLNSVLFVVAVGLIYLSSARRINRLGLIALALSPFWIYGSRHPGNGFTYFPFLLLWTHLTLSLPSFNRTRLVLLGFLAGFIVNFYLLTLLLIVPVIIIRFFTVRPRLHLLFFLCAFLSTFSPLLLFELSHDFVITRGIFISRNFQYSLSVGSRSVLDTAAAAHQYLSSHIGFPVTLLVFAWLCLIFIMRQKRTISLLLILSSGFLIAVGLFRIKLEAHYLYPLAIGCVYFALTVFSSQKYRVFSGVWLVLVLLAFPFKYYLPSPRHPEEFALAVETAVDRGFITHPESFNVMGIIDPGKYVVNGNEYRFFLMRRNLYPLPESEYARAQNLIIFSEDKSDQIDHLSTWETGQFDLPRSVLTNQLSVGRINLFSFSKPPVN